MRRLATRIINMAIQYKPKLITHTGWQKGDRGDIIIGVGKTRDRCVSLYVRANNKRLNINQMRQCVPLGKENLTQWGRVCHHVPSRGRKAR